MNETYKQLLDKAAAWIEAHKAEYIAELQGIARIPSVSRADLAQPGAPFGPDCRKVLDYALERGRYYGFDVQDHDGCLGSITMGDQENAIGMIAHLDVVPVGDGWKYPQFGATYIEEYDAMVGRGVGDNKGPWVAGLFAMRMLREFGWTLKHGIRLMCGMSEETGMQDVQMMLDRGEKFPKLTLVPDAAFPVNYAQKGSVDAELTMMCGGNVLAFDAGSVRNIIPDLAVCELAADVPEVQAAFAKLPAEETAPITIEPCEGGTRIAAHGKSGHAASPASSINAIMLLTHALSASGVVTGTAKKTIDELAALTADSFGISEGIAYSDEASGDTTLVYGVAHLKDGVLTVSVDCRYSISLKGDELCAKLTKHWQSCGWEVCNLEYTNPFYIVKDDPRVVALQQLYTEVTGREDEPYTMGGGTYSRVMPNAITFGPGVPGTKHEYPFLPEGHGGAHGRDEVTAMESVYTCSRIYTAALAALDEIEA